MSDIGNQLRRIREAQGRIQADIAHEISIAPAYLSEIERGHRSNLDRALTMLRRIAAVYGYEIVVELRERQ